MEKDCWDKLIHVPPEGIECDGVWCEDGRISSVEQTKFIQEIFDLYFNKFLNKYMVLARTYEDKLRGIVGPPPPDSGSGDDSKIISASSGTGFFITKKGLLITNNHVIDSCNEVRVHYKGDEKTTKLISRDLVNDLALLKSQINPDGILSVSNEDIDLIENIYVAGFPFGMEISSSIKVTGGLVSSLSGANNNFSHIQIDAALQPGNSGGPIIDEKGNVVAVAVAKIDYIKIIEIFKTFPENINFGIKSSVLKTFLKSNNVTLVTPSDVQLPKSEIRQKIREATVYLDCWMTQAKINDLRSRKALFENLK